MSTTESSSNYNHLEQMSVHDLLTNINKEDQSVPLAVQKSLPQIGLLVDQIVKSFEQGGRLFYIGAGTSGRLGIVDASECPPTFGVPHGMVVGIIAGGDTAIRKAVEFAEDNEELGWNDLLEYDINTKDIVVGIAASGRTPYVIGAVQQAKRLGITTGCVVCNSDSKLAAAVDFPVEVVVGPEFVTGSTRLKSGTAQKLVLNMLTTASMIKIGRVKGNKMVDMQLSNLKLIDRGTRMVMSEIDVDYDLAKQLLTEHGSVRKAVEAYIK
jgi:N-acetylmuramic acid 6-phosphate etherase